MIREFLEAFDVEMEIRRTELSCLSLEEFMDGHPEYNDLSIGKLGRRCHAFRKIYRLEKKREILKERDVEKDGKIFDREMRILEDASFGEGEEAIMALILLKRYRDGV